LIRYVKPFAKQLDIEAAQIYDLPEDCQELRVKSVGTVINQLKRCASSWYYILCMLLFDVYNKFFLVIFGAESFVFHVAIQKFKDQDI